MRPFKRLAIVLAPVALIVAGVLLLGESPPSELFEKSRKELEAARAARAADFAPAQFERAQETWEVALNAWRAENERVAAFRSFDSVSIRLDEAESAAIAARSRAIAVVDSLKAAADRQMAEARALRGPLEEAASFFPVGFVDRPALMRAHTDLSMTESALKREDWWKAAEASASALSTYQSLTALARERIAPLVTSSDDWRRRRDRLVAGKTGPIIVVDKAARELYLYQGGKVETFKVELGRRWIGDKRMEGDRATPEGLYSVTRKLGRGQTIYHRALYINYPNDEDRRQFAQGKRNGSIPAGARIGGNIEIHGGGGRDADWTDGCVALPDRTMELIFNRVPVGTPVLIAGSLTGRYPLVEPNTDGTDR